jgi:hypothetical protein
MRTIRVKSKFRDYYPPKVAEAVSRRDKNKMSGLNALRNKPVYLVFALVQKHPK